MWFPPPDYLALPALGIDISDRSIKFSELCRSDGILQVKVSHEEPLEPGIVESGKILDIHKLAETLRKIKKVSSSNFVNVSLPEEQAYIFSLELPGVLDHELRESIELSLEENVPLKASESVFDYELLTDASSRREIVVSTFPKSLASAYVTACEDAGFLVVGQEIESQSVARVLIPPGRASLEPILLVDFGRTRVGFSIVVSNVVVLSRTIAHFGGEGLTQAIARSLKISVAEADDLKVKQGLHSVRTGHNLAEALAPWLSVLKDELAKVFSYWDNPVNQSPISRGKINKVILSGGEAALPGLTGYLAANLEVPVVLGNIRVNIAKVTNPMRFATALGLALRSFSI